MKQILIAFVAFVFFSAAAQAQLVKQTNTVVNTKPDMAVRVNTLEQKVADLEAANNTLQSQLAALQNQLNKLSETVNSNQDQVGKLSTTVTANYKLLDYSLSQFKQQVTGQIGTFHITGFIGTKALGTASPVNVLIGQKD